jgi:hypothetical protein
MEAAERPPDELKRCLNGVIIRNAIMHAGIQLRIAFKTSARLANAASMSRWPSHFFGFASSARSSPKM